MSEGARLSLEDALAAATCVVNLWGLTTPDVLLVGSVRRRRPDVGDLEFTCRRPREDESDLLYDRMAPHVRVGGLFSATDEGRVAEAIKGFSKHFGYADLRLDLTNEATGKSLVIRVQIHRWEPDGHNRGWIELMRTGPQAFGIWFLKQWKARWHIPGNKEASHEGSLVDAAGNQVAVPTELDCFRRSGIPFIEPDARDAYIEKRTGQSRQLEAWRMK